MSGPDKKARAAALEELRQGKFDDIQAIYAAMYAIATSKEVEPKDAVNASKVCAMLLGVGRPGPEKPAEAPKDASPATQTAPLTDERMNEVLSKLGAK